MSPRTVTTRRTALRAAAIAVGVAVAAGVPTAVSAAAATAPASTSYTGTLANGTTWIADVPAQWNGTLLLYSHGFGPLTAADAPDPATQAALLARGYALAGSSYDPNGSEWALDTAVRDQFGTLTAVEATVLPSRPAQVLAFGTSMGGLVSALEAQDGAGRINGALTTCGIVAGGDQPERVPDRRRVRHGPAAAARPAGPAGRVRRRHDRAGHGRGPDGAAAAGAADRRRAGPARPGARFPQHAPVGLRRGGPGPGQRPGGAGGRPVQREFAGAFSILDFIELGRASIDQADGGSANWNVGINYARVLAGSPFHKRGAGPVPGGRTQPQRRPADLTKNATSRADPAAVSSLEQTSVPTGRLAVPELDLHTIGDNLVPVSTENYYAKQVTEAGDSGLLRQAYTESFGHCNFSPAELVAGVLASAPGHHRSLGPRRRRQPASTRWPAGLNLGAARFAEITTPVPLTGAIGARRTYRPG